MAEPRKHIALGAFLPGNRHPASRAEARTGLLRHALHERRLRAEVSAWLSFLPLRDQVTREEPDLMT